MIPAKSLLLLSCRSPFLDDSKIYCPMANLYLKSYINEYLPDVSVTLGDDEYDLNNLSHMEPFDAIGISVMTPQRQEAVTLARAIKHRWPAKTVIVGGPHVRHYLHQLCEESSFDYLVPMDGERALVMILSGRATSRIVRNILTRDEVATQPRPDRSSPNAVEVLRKYHYFLGEREATTIMTARGCPEQCAFCEDAVTQVRWSGLESIRDQLSDIVHLGYRGVYIFDDLFTMSIQKIRPICDQLSKFDLAYRCNAQARYFTRWGDEMAKLLAETGCHEIAFGAESGSQKILDNIRKRCTIEQNYKTVEYAKKYELIVKAFILIGLPGETWQTLEETESFIRDSGCDDYQIAVYMPFKGTRIREAMDSGEPIDISMSPAGSDGEISGAYGINGGETAYEVRTSELSTEDIKSFREYLVTTYRPTSHARKWANQDRFFEQAHAGGSSA